VQGCCPDLTLAVHLRDHTGERIDRVRASRVGSRLEDSSDDR
jgi:hypothetical protein